jgi:hypothetical protein
MQYRKYSNNFNLIFTFFLQSYRYKILDFCGVDVRTRMDINCGDGKYCMSSFDNGEYDKEQIHNTGIPTKHPNILKGVIIGKKSWGLHMKMWSEGISEGTFTMEEILEQFHEKNIIVPECFITDFENTIRKKKGNYRFS